MRRSLDWNRRRRVRWSKGESAADPNKDAGAWCVREGCCCSIISRANCVSRLPGLSARDGLEGREASSPDVEGSGGCRWGEWRGERPRGHVMVLRGSWSRNSLCILLTASRYLQNPPSINVSSQGVGWAKPCLMTRRDRSSGTTRLRDQPQYAWPGATGLVIFRHFQRVPSAAQYPASDQAQNEEYCR